ncbi:MAG: TonB-dependent receptor [Gallionellaceae bacterium]|nr:TonB-dependent receptor [Gallionellaceae bacterium]
MNNKKLFSALLATLCSGAALAGEPSDDIFLADLPTVLTASRIEQSPMDAPAPVTVIDRETIRASGFTEIHDLLRLVPGFQVADWAGGGAVVANHGMGTAYPHNLLVMLDGRSVVNPVLGTVNWQDLPVRLEDIERIEVVRGPNQASYGAAAYNGVVNIITRSPGEDDGAALVLSRGERGFADNYVRLGRRGENFDWRISASDRSATPFRDLPRPGYYRRETNERQTLRSEFSYRPSLDQEINADFSLAQGADLKGTSKSAEEPYHERDVDNATFHIAWHRNYAPGSELLLRYFHYRQSDQERYVGRVVVPPTIDVLADLSYASQRDDLEFQQTHRFSDVLQGVWGASLRRDRIDSSHYFYGEEVLKGTDWQVFGNLDWRFSPDWLLHVGGMVERHYNTDTLSSPRVALNYMISPNQSLRVSAGSGYRAPNIVEFDANEVFPILTPLPPGYPHSLPGLTSPGGIRPEQVDFRDLGYVARFKELGLQLDARVYAEDYSDVIWAPGASVQNVPGTVRVKGGELAIDWTHAVLGRVRLSHAVVDIEGGGAGFGSDTDKVSRSAPRHSTSLLWSRNLPWGLAASLGYYQVGDMIWLGDGDRQAAYERVDVKLAKRFGRPGSEDEIALTVQNANGRRLEFLSGTDANYTERQAFVTLRLGW